MRKADPSETSALQKNLNYWIQVQYREILQAMIEEANKEEKSKLEFVDFVWALLFMRLRDNPEWVNQAIFSGQQKGVGKARRLLMELGARPKSPINDTPLDSWRTPLELEMQRPEHQTSNKEVASIAIAGLTVIIEALHRDIAERVIAANRIVDISWRGVKDIFNKSMSKRVQQWTNDTVMRGFLQGQAQLYRDNGIEDGTVMSEMGQYATAGDDKVCSLCVPKEGMVATIAYLLSILPLHPLCRCIIVPVLRRR